MLVILNCSSEALACTSSKLIYLVLSSLMGCNEICYFIRPYSVMVYKGLHVITDGDREVEVRQGVYASTWYVCRSKLKRAAVTQPSLEQEIKYGHVSLSVSSVCTNTSTGVIWK
jgi:hypothetical protein